MLLTYVVKLVEGKILMDIVEMVNSAIGKGTNESFSKDEEAFAYSNTPVQNGWLRIPADEPFIADLEFLIDQPTMQVLIGEVVEQMWLEDEGQKEVDIGDGQLLGYISNALYYQEVNQ